MKPQRLNEKKTDLFEEGIKNIGKLLTLVVLLLTQLYMFLALLERDLLSGFIEWSLYVLIIIFSSSVVYIVLIYVFCKMRK